MAIATTRGSAKKQFLLDAGADHVIVTNEEDLGESVMAITAGTGPTSSLTLLAAPCFRRSPMRPAVGATIVEYGALSPDPTPFPLFSALKKGLTVRGYTLFEIVKDAHQACPAASSMSTTASNLAAETRHRFHLPSGGHCRRTPVHGVQPAKGKIRGDREQLDLS